MFFCSMDPENAVAAMIKAVGAAAIIIGHTYLKLGPGPKSLGATVTIIAKYRIEFSDVANAILLLLPALVTGLGLEKTTPYLKVGKQMALNEKDSKWQQNLLMKVLEFESTYNLKGQKETIDTLKEAILKSDRIFERAVLAIIDAELKALL